MVGQYLIIIDDLPFGVQHLIIHCNYRMILIHRGRVQLRIYCAYSRSCLRQTLLPSLDRIPTPYFLNTQAEEVVPCRVEIDITNLLLF